jgi:aryl-alcohol dehydrogenase-like predicted oxidoreductase
MVSPIGFGAFKIGRNIGAKYADRYELPSEVEVDRLLNGVLDLGINYIDTAPAYGTSEGRIGRAIACRRNEFVISTKVGEEFGEGASRFDFSPRAVRASVERSRTRLQTVVIDVVFIHSDGRDREIMESSGAIDELEQLKSEGIVRAIGFSGKTVEGARLALEWADAIMVEYHLENRAHEDVIDEARSRGVGIIVKKGLASGRLTADKAIPFVLKNDGVSSLVIGGLNLDHIRANVELAR